ncbi:MAG: sigma-70 family RNA polymerase sigma factor [Magnetococcales bacterium]|nr:sigma-70 family RNA polymerase sigma factor [Magnetococcales bacterium]
MKNTDKPLESELVIREKIRRCQTMDDPQTMEEIVSRFMPMVVRLAGGLHPGFRDDLIQEGCMGLIQSVQRFDPEHATRFSTFAYHYIRGRMLQFLNTKASIVRHPQGGMILCKSLDIPVFYDDDAVPLVELLQSRDPSPEERMIRKDIQTRLLKAIDGLSETEKMIIHHYFWKSATLDDTARKLGLSREMVRRMGLEALKKIRHRLLKPPLGMGVTIRASVVRRELRKKKGIVVSLGKKIIDFSEFPILSFALFSPQGRKILQSSDIRLIKQTAQSDSLCVVRVEKEIAVRAILKLVRLLALHLAVPKKNITVELTSE